LLLRVYRAVGDLIRIAKEVVPAVAHFPAKVNPNVTFRTRLASETLGSIFRFRFLLDRQSHWPSCIGLPHRALWMDALARVGVPGERPITTADCPAFAEPPQQDHPHQ
jgi:hypothetical protein